MPVDTKHPAYNDQRNKWRTVNDALGGEDHVKDKGTMYLPAPPSMAGSGSWNRASKTGIGQVGPYGFYLSFAEFPEIVSDVLGGFQGLIHSKPPTVNLPKDMEYLIKDATPSGISLSALWQDVTNMIIRGGRSSLLADISSDGKFRIAAYSAESFINWREFRPIDGGGFMFAVLEEESMVAKQDDRFSQEEVDRLLELFIVDGDTGNHEYFHRWWTEQDVEGNGKTEWVPGPASRVELNGKPIDHVPMIVINAVDSGTKYGHIPLYGMSKRAFSIYRKTADYNRSLYTKSDPQIVLAGVSADDTPSQIGGSTIWAFTNPAASAKYLDIDGQGIPLQRISIMDEYERFYQEGGKLIHSEGGAGESGQALQTRSNSNQVTLKSIAINAAKHIEGMLRDIGEMLGLSNLDKITFSPDLDFAQPSMSGQELLNCVQSKNQSGPISNKTIHELMHRGGVTEMPFDEEMALVEEERAEAEKHAKQPNAQTPSPDTGESKNKTPADLLAEAELKKKIDAQAAADAKKKK